MESHMQRSLSVLSAAALIAGLIGVTACQKSQSLTPTVPTGGTVTPADGSTLKASAPSPRSPVGDTRLETFTNPTLTAGTATLTYGGGATLQYRFQLLSDSAAFIQDSGLRTSPSWVPTATLDFDKRYQWQVRAETTDGAVGPWSARASFLSPNGGFIRGSEVFDPLTNGRTVAIQNGGHFVTGANGGWESNTLGEGLDYDIATCSSCKAEFDVTNFGSGEGTSIEKDVKWFTMGDRGSWGSFLAFRDHPWKMHLEQRSDGDGTGMQVIWRNGTADADSGGDPDYGDHRGKFLGGGPAFGHSFDNKVWHFVIEWTTLTYKISIGEVGKPLTEYFPARGSSGYFANGHPYAPPNHRIELGCIPRGESMIGARYRNFRVTKQ